MASACKSVADCIDAREPVRATYVNLYGWPESDAEFVRTLTLKNKCANKDANYHQRNINIDYARNDEKRNLGRESRSHVLDSYSCRQMYLRSYTFSKKESVPERTVKCLGIVKDKISFPFVCPNRDHEEFDRGSNTTVDSERENKKKKKKRKKRKKKESVTSTAKKLKEVSCNVVWMIFHRLLACAASVDVVDR